MELTANVNLTTAQQARDAAAFLVSEAGYRHITADEATAYWSTIRAFIDAAEADQRRIEVLRTERDQVWARFNMCMKILIGINALLYPSPIKCPGGETYVFDQPEADANEWMRRISERIRAIPDEIAAIDAAMEQAADKPKDHP